MLDGYGLHTIIWDSADERLGSCYSIVLRRVNEMLT